MVALRERDAAVQRCELQSGRALQKMLAEGLSMKEAMQWCGPEVGRREAGRLIKLTEEADALPQSDSGESTAKSESAAALAAVVDPARVERESGQNGDRAGPECRWWTGAVSGRGHGRFWIGGHVMIAHRWTVVRGGSPHGCRRR